MSIYTKLCVRCKLKKPISEFHKNSRSKDGLHSYCKKCNAENAALFLKTDKGKIALNNAISKAKDRGYYRYGKGAIPILRQGADRRGISFELTSESLEAWWSSQPDICYYCGISIEEYLEIRDFLISYNGNNFEINKFKRFYRNSKHQSIRWMTIDRLKNDQGYKPTNMVKSCWICNSLKSDFFEGDHMKMIAPQIISRLKIEIDKEIK